MLNSQDVEVYTTPDYMLMVHRDTGKSVKCEKSGIYYLDKSRLFQALEEKLEEENET